MLSKIVKSEGSLGYQKKSVNASSHKYLKAGTKIALKDRK